jgi:hypothetical protein
MRAAAIASLAAVALFTFARDVWAEDVRVSVPGAGALVLPAPEGWRSGRQPGAVPTVSLTPASGNSFLVMVSPLVATDGRVAPSSPESLRRLVELGASMVKPQAVEASLPIQSFGSGEVQGSYFSATDRAPKPGEFKYMTQGAVSVNGVPVAFTILTNGNPQAVIEPALRMLAGARKE